MTATVPAKSKYYYRLYTYVEKVNSDAEKLKGKKMTLSLETNINN